MPKPAAVGVTENANTAILVTVTPDGTLLDRRRIELTDPGLPTHPHHHQGSWAIGRYLDTPGAHPLSLADAIALVERVQSSATRGISAMGHTVGPPWQKPHKLAAAAALATFGRPGSLR